MASTNSKSSAPGRSLKSRLVRLRPKSDKTEAALLDDLEQAARRIDPARLQDFIEEETHNGEEGRDPDN